MYIDQKDQVVHESLKLLAGNPDNLGRAYVSNTFQYRTTNMNYHSGGTFRFSSWIALYSTKNRHIISYKCFSQECSGEIKPSF
ncbi:MAG: hypothetical protein V7719_12600 [Psychroserpens sp.]|uniref:hypothetical protein n=1 Tax=Psychroserpens sp. TaxID=2020870 RepID=UPI0030033D3A